MLHDKHHGLFLALENIISEIIILIFSAKFSSCYFNFLIEYVLKLNCSQDTLAPNFNTTVSFFSKFLWVNLKQQQKLKQKANEARENHLSNLFLKE